MPDIGLYIFIYLIADEVLRKYYLNLIPFTSNTELITNNANFYYAVTTINTYIFWLYLCFVYKHYIYCKSKDIYSLALALIYMKYCSTLFFVNTMSLYEYEYRRLLMWLFSTPVMLQMYCVHNKITYKDISAFGHIIPVAMSVVIYPFKNTAVYSYINLLLHLPLCVFMKSLYEKKHLKFTNLYLLVWSLFIVTYWLEQFHIIDAYSSNIFYLISDTVGKITTNIIVSDNCEHMMSIKQNADVQSVHFTTNLLDFIKDYEQDNKTSDKCKTYIEYIRSHALSGIPDSSDLLKTELIQKMLPLGFDNQLLSAVKPSASGNKSFEMVCILFTDIVNYTELAKQYDASTIFSLLNNVYINFDKTIKRFKHLQKIETIGDAYMVVGDIYRNQHNHQTVVKEIIELAVKFIHNIKTIRTPNGVPLSLRVGINMGNVSVGLLGNEVPRLCIVGNAVNVASRLQSTAEPDSIQISHHIYEQIIGNKYDFGYDIIEKNDVFLKNIGSVKTYNIFPLKDVTSIKNNIKKEFKE